MRTKYYKFKLLNFRKNCELWSIIDKERQTCESATVKMRKCLTQVRQFVLRRNGTEVCTPLKVDDFSMHTSNLINN